MGSVMNEDPDDRPLDELGVDAILKAIEQHRVASATALPDEERTAYLGFYLGQEIYGVPVQRLREVARATRVRKVPGAPPTIAGLVNLRGEIICALEARELLNLPTAAAPDSRILIVLQGFEDPLGIIVDAIADVYAIASGEIEPPPVTWTPDRAHLFVGTVHVPGGLMGLLDVDRLVTP